jgi:hypothetical protein
METALGEALGMWTLGSEAPTDASMPGESTEIDDRHMRAVHPSLIGQFG